MQQEVSAQMSRSVPSGPGTSISADPDSDAPAEGPPQATPAGELFTSPSSKGLYLLLIHAHGKAGSSKPTRGGKRG